MFEINAFRKFRDVIDGLSNTLMQYESCGRTQSWVHGRPSGAPAWWDGRYRAWTGNFNANWFYTAEFTTTAGSDVPTVNWFVGARIINTHNWNAPYSFHPGGIQITLGDGSVRLSTYESGDGAPLGEYAVTVRWPPDVTVPSLEDRLGGAYATAQTSRWKVEITETENRLPEIAIEAPKLRSNQAAATRAAPTGPPMGVSAKTP